jgi:hypothetical protein
MGTRNSVDVESRCGLGGNLSGAPFLASFMRKPCPELRRRMGFRRSTKKSGRGRRFSRWESDQPGNLPQLLQLPPQRLHH